MSIQKLILDDGTENGVKVHVVMTDRGNHRIIVGPEGTFPHIKDKDYYYFLCNSPKVGERLEVNGMKLQLGTLMRDHSFFTPQTVRVNDSFTV